MSLPPITPEQRREAMGLSYMVPMFFYEVGLGIWLLVRGLREPVAG